MLEFQDSECWDKIVGSGQEGHLSSSGTCDSEQVYTS